METKRLQIAPRFKRVLVGKIINSTGEVTVNAIDPMAVDLKKQYRANIEEWMMNQDLLEQGAAHQVRGPSRLGAPQHLLRQYLPQSVGLGPAR